MTTQNKPYWMMPIWKLMLLSAFCGTVIVIVLWSLGRSSHSLGIFTAKQPMKWPQEVEAKEVTPMPGWICFRFLLRVGD